MNARMSAARKTLGSLLSAADHRYVDLAVQLRRLTVDLPAPAAQGTVLACQGVELRTLAPGQQEVPVVSCTRYASAALADGAPLEGGGTFHGEVLLEAGGRWDSLKRSYVAATEERPLTPLLYDLMESQVEMSRWFSAWLRRWKWRQESAKKLKTSDTRAMLFYGNRSGGKTELFLWLTLAFAVESASVITWVISCSRPQSQEDVHERLVDAIPKTWGAYQGQPVYAWRLINNSRIREMTGDAPEDLKQGRVDLAFLNEGQKMDKRSYAYPIGRISDLGGIMLIAANPPTADIPKGGWVLDLYNQVEDMKKQGKSCPQEVLRCDAAGNASIDQGAREDVGELLRIVSPEIAAADADGSMKGFLPKLIYEYERTKHGMAAPPDIGLGDVTEAFTKKKFNRAFPFLAGVDFQNSPYIIASYWKLYGDINAPILWCLAEHTTHGSEDDFLDEALQVGIQLAPGKGEEIDPGTVLWVGDSSAQWQDRRTRGQQSRLVPPSFAFWRQRGLVIVPPTTKISEGATFARNPPLQVSYGQTNRLVKEGRLKISPLAQIVEQAFRECVAKRMPTGGVKAEPRWAHAIDTARYVCWWVDPVTKRQSRQPATAPRQLVYTVP